MACAFFIIFDLKFILFCFFLSVEFQSCLCLYNVMVNKSRYKLSEKVAESIGIEPIQRKRN